MHDIIIGGFGRSGLLRYFHYFSNFEKNLIKAKLAGEDFYDEYRLVNYTVIGELRRIKSRYLDFYKKGFDRSILVGVKGGISLEEIFPDFIREILPHLNTVISKGSREIRVIIPCNTLAELSIKMEHVLTAKDGIQQYYHPKTETEINEFNFFLRHHESLTIQVPTVPEAVLKSDKLDGAKKILLIGTISAIKAYSSIINRHHFQIEIVELNDLNNNLNFDVILKSIGGEKPDTSFLSKLPNDIKIVSACTDVEIPGTIDSVTEFAKHLASEIY